MGIEALAQSGPVSMYFGIYAGGVSGFTWQVKRFVAQSGGQPRVDGSAAGYLANQPEIGQVLYTDANVIFGFFEGFYWGIPAGSAFNYLPPAKNVRYACQVMRSTAAGFRGSLAAVRCTIPAWKIEQNALRMV